MRRFPREAVFSSTAARGSSATRTGSSRSVLGVKSLRDSLGGLLRPSTRPHRPKGLGEVVRSDPDRDRTCDLAFRNGSQSRQQEVSRAVSTLTASHADVSMVLTETRKSPPHVPAVGQADPLLTLLDVADCLRVSLAVVEDLVSRRALRALRIGPERRVRPEDLQLYLREAEE